jgi:hypothetical protein
MSNISMTVPWSEGALDDFGDLHEALKSGKTQKFSSDDNIPESGSEDDQGSDSEEEEIEVEPSPDDHGNVLIVNNLHPSDIFNFSRDELEMN